MGIARTQYYCVRPLPSGDVVLPAFLHADVLSDLLSPQFLGVTEQIC